MAGIYCVTLMVMASILRREPALTQFETAQIANLCPVTAEEAKSCIPRCDGVQYDLGDAHIPLAL